MYRTAIDLLYAWKNRKKRKPLIIRGARQVGKTWLMKEFGRVAYEEVVYINFDHNRQMEQLFSSDLKIERIVLGLEVYCGKKIKAEDTLLIFDEIQEVPQALAALKYFNEEAPQYQIMCAGSLLGIALHEGTSFPVGKVEFMDLYPLSFAEFLQAMGKDSLLDLLRQLAFDVTNSFSDSYEVLLKQYYYIGGMPEAVQSFLDDGDFLEVREIQQRILDAYIQDFSKHAPNDIVPRLRGVWDSIPSQLAKENRKFIYGLIKEGARAKEYELALLWLMDCGLAYKIQRVTKPALPLKGYEDLKAFKLFLLDVGLLSCMVHLDASVFLEGNRLFSEFKGALTEQYVLQQLKVLKGLDAYYWTNDRNSAEIDFLVEYGSHIVPIEVKAEENLKAKSLKVFCEKFQPSLAVRTSLANYREEEKLVNVPLWAIGSLPEIIGRGKGHTAC